MIRSSYEQVAWLMTVNDHKRPVRFFYRRPCLAVPLVREDSALQFEFTTQGSCGSVFLH